MKYFTPELYVRGQTNVDEILTEVERLWDEAGDRYVSDLDLIRPEMPPGLRHLDRSFYLHDAEILGMGREDQALIVLLRLDTPPQSLLTFSYDLTGEPVINADALPPEHRTPAQRARWLYDEIEKAPGQPPTWSQSILLSNGWEVKVLFRDVDVHEIQPLLPVSSGTCSAGPSTVSQSA